ncbi:cell division protein FtsZ [bacterium]|nr:cell division protein FtsZ [bacterium]
MMSVARLKVIGCGGAGGNAIDRMIAAELRDVEFVAVNTDLQALMRNSAAQKVQIGARCTRGLGAGGDPNIGMKAAEEDRETVADMLQDTDMVFITAGMGGGTGTGAAPIIAEIAKDQNCLTVAVVTKPFDFERGRRRKTAEKGIAELKEKVDTLIVIPNQRLLSITDDDITLVEAFQIADEVLLNATRGISDLITVPGIINLDFADVKAVLTDMGGDALMGNGIGSGPNKALEAAKSAISSPLLEGVSIEGAKGVLINITCGTECKLREVNEAASLISEVAGEDANIIFGSVVDPNAGDEMRVTVIAAGFQKKQVKQFYQHREPQVVNLFDKKFDMSSISEEAEEEIIHEIEDEFDRLENDDHDVDPMMNADFAPVTSNDMEIPAYMRKHNMNNNS